MSGVLMRRIASHRWVRSCSSIDTGVAPMKFSLMSAPAAKARSLPVRTMPRPRAGSACRTAGAVNLMPPMNVEIEDPLIESKRLERTLGVARLAGALLVFALGPMFPSIGAEHVMLLGGSLLAWALLNQRLVERARSHEEHDRVARIGFVVDTIMVVYAVWIFSVDPQWTTWVVGVLLIIASSFRFGRWGALLSTSILTLAYLGVAAYRQSAYGYPLEPQRAAFHVAVYLLTALVMSGAIRELHELRQQREHQFFHDLLTGLPNRALLSDRLSQALLRIPRTADPVSLLLMDLNDFKAVNDSLGHAVGDDLLRQVGPRLAAQLRTSCWLPVARRSSRATRPRRAGARDAVRAVHRHAHLRLLRRAARRRDDPRPGRAGDQRVAFAAMDRRGLSRRALLLFARERQPGAAFGAARRPGWVDRPAAVQCGTGAGGDDRALRSSE